MALTRANGAPLTRVRSELSQPTDPPRRSQQYDEQTGSTLNASRARPVEDWRREVYRSRRVPDSVRVLLLLLAERMRPDLTVSVPRAELAEALSLSPRRVSERLATAVQARLLERLVRGQKHVTAVYRGTWPDGLSVTDSLLSEDGLSVSSTSTQGGAESPHPEPASAGPTGVPPAVARRHRTPVRDQPVPTGFLPSADNRRLAAQIGADVEHERRAFLRKYLGSDVLRADWQATFRRWLENVERSGPSPAEAPPVISGYHRHDPVPLPDFNSMTPEETDAYYASVLPTLPPPRTSSW